MKISVRKCEHENDGNLTTIDINTPLDVEILDCSENQDDSEFIVWLKTKQDNVKSWYLATVSEPTKCKIQAKFIANAVSEFIFTPHGEKAALNLISDRF